MPIDLISDGSVLPLAQNFYIRMRQSVSPTQKISLYCIQKHSHWFHRNQSKATSTHYAVLLALVIEIGPPNTAVFVSRTGAKYHREDCRFVSKPPAADMKRKVFVTRTGGTYHRDGCRFLAKSKIEMALGLARQKYRPCSRCAPPK